MSGNQNKILGKRSKNGPPSDLEVVALGGANRKKPPPAAATSAATSLSHFGKTLECDEKLITNIPPSSLSSSSTTISHQEQHGGGGGGGVGQSLTNKKLKSDQGSVVVPPPSLSTVAPPPIPGMVQSQSQPHGSMMQRTSMPNHGSGGGINASNINNNSNNNFISGRDTIDMSNTLDIIQALESEMDREQCTRTVRNMLQSIKSMPATTAAAINSEPFVSLIGLARKRPDAFSSIDLLDTLLALLRRDPTQLNQQKKNNFPMVLACNLLMVAYESLPDWPPQLFYAFIEDSIGDRLWVDDQNCKAFTAAIVSSLPSKPGYQLNAPTSSVIAPPTLYPKTAAAAAAIVTPVAPPKVQQQQQQDTNMSSHDSGDEEIEEEILSSSSTFGSAKSENNSLSRSSGSINSNSSSSRFSQCQPDIIRYIVQQIKSTNVSYNARGLLRLLTLTVGFKESRVEGASLVETLLANQNVFRNAKEYLALLVAHCTDATPEDLRTVQTLIRINVVSAHTEVIPTLLANNPAAYTGIAMRQAIELELDVPGLAAFPTPGKPPSVTGNSNVAGTKSKLGTIFRHLAPQRGEEELAAILKELAVRDDYAKMAARMTVRKIVKNFISVNMAYFCSQLTDISRDEVYLSRDPATKQRWALNMVHVFCQILLLVPSFVDISKDANSMRQLLSNITASIITWCSNLLDIGITTPQEHIEHLKKLIFIDNINTYFVTPNTIVDSDRNAYRILSNEVQIQETLIESLLSLAFEHGVDNRLILDFIDSVLRRALSILFKFGVPCAVTRGNMADQVMELSVIGGTKQTLGDLRISFTPIFWQATTSLCLLACLAPSSVGANAWLHCPTVRVLLEMIVTRTWKFPPYVSKTTPANQYQINELNQKNRENELAARFPQLQQVEFSLFDPRGPSRQPPDDVIERVQRLDTDFHLGISLCACRQPDYLLEIMGNQDSRQVMSWLTPIIHNDPRTLDILPPVCLAEVLLSSQLSVPVAIAQSVTPKLLQRIHQFFSNASTPQPTIDIMRFFFNNLCSPSSVTRTVSKRAINLLPAIGGPASGSAPDDYQWLNRLQSLQHYASIAPIVLHSLRAALHVESDLRALRAYLNYLYSSYSNSGVGDRSLVLDISRLLLQRDIVARYLINDPIVSVAIDVLMGAFTIDDYPQLLQDYNNSTSNNTAEYMLTMGMLRWKVEGQTVQVSRFVADAVVYLVSLADSKNAQLSARLLKLVNNLVARPLTPALEYIDENGAPTTLLKTQSQATMVLQSSVGGLIDLAVARLNDSQLFEQIVSFAVSPLAREMIGRHLDRVAGLSDGLGNILSGGTTRPSIDQAIQIIKSYKSAGMKSGSKLISCLEKMNHSGTNHNSANASASSSRRPSKEGNSLLSLFNSSITLGAQADHKQDVSTTKMSIDSPSPVASAKKRALHVRAISTPAGTMAASQCLNVSNNVITSEHIAAILSCAAIDIDMDDDQLAKAVTQSLCQLITQSPSLAHFERYLGALFGKIYGHQQASLKHRTLPAKTHAALLRGLVFTVKQLASASTVKLSYAVGILLDWILQLIPQCQSEQDIVTSLFGLMFERSAEPGAATASSVAFSTLLRSHFVHNSTWRALSLMVDMFFSPRIRAKQDTIDYTSLLSFIAAYHSHPRSSAPYYSSPTEQSIDSSTTHYLTPYTTRTLADYIMREMDTTHSHDNVLRKRRVLLNSSARQCDENIVSLALHLANSKASVTSGGSIMSSQTRSLSVPTAAQSILLQLYYSFPSLIKAHVAHYSPNINVQDNAQHSQSQSQSLAQQPDKDVHGEEANANGIPHTNLDTIIHRVILKINEADMRSESFVLLRKLTIGHPELITSHLPTIFTLFSGRSNLPIAQFIQKKYQSLYIQLLDIMDILNPFVFNSPYFEKIMSEYFMFFGNVRSFFDELIPLISKFTEFLSAHTSTGRIPTLIVNRNNDTLVTLSNLYQNIPSIKALVNKFMLQTSSYSTSSSHHGSYKQQQQQQQQQQQWTVQHNIQQARIVQIKHELIIAMQQQHERQHNNGNNNMSNSMNNNGNNMMMITTMNKSDERLLRLLQEIERITYTTPSALPLYLESITPLIESNNVQIRSITYFLLLRYLNHSPKQSGAIVDTYLGCFRSANPEVVKSALQNASQFFHFTQGSTEHLVQQVLLYGGRESIQEIKKLIHPFIRIYS
ncbi:hypothetical protein SAMD00019534_020620 [Acytostelium subglobosum LB1]|uniref:hypothetical protein n=1 Tax=Acytostelium subglobosum LB1 TaxID=1410327 RepID=UPI000644F7C9|nr:hypothetical protein SAMD00019534_020620 [Acytostelium subglobosum LB1]GAM18887.1 hypothetical protein SAMD00019534_020620 [Acytostelium subglobosum LB1]|eukprot:XP_012758107.1 hypothetical protein SAMD00019534_020620 [Acytostelium subglobosum LB1]